MTVAGPVIVDGGGANLASLKFALERLSVSAPLSADPERIRNASHVFLPGVGTAKAGMERLSSQGLDSLLPELEQPVLGICLGMQLMFTRSEEDDTQCLGMLPGNVRRLQPGPAVRVPHMGWNQVRKLDNDRLLEQCPDGSYCYFVHSYAAEADGPYTLAVATHGQRFAAVVRRNNFVGTQFHPERSGAPGAAILRAFLRS
jgi:glutamine amidotransferase